MNVNEDLAWAVHDDVPPDAGRIVDRGLGQSFPEALLNT
jgi:hypothetical protein